MANEREERRVAMLAVQVTDDSLIRWPECLEQDEGAPWKKQQSFRRNSAVYAGPMTHPSEIRERLRTFALTLPEAHEDGPWGETVVKVRNKIFVFLGTDGAPDPGFGVKLQESHEEALATPGVTPSGYGLGKSGWVNVVLPAAATAEPELYREWVLESYRTVAPKRLVAALDAGDERNPGSDT